MKTCGSIKDIGLTQIKLEPEEFVNTNVNPSEESQTTSSISKVKQNNEIFSGGRTGKFLIAFVKTFLLVKLLIFFY